jgi:hypothetical protein
MGLTARFAGRHREPLGISRESRLPRGRTAPPFEAFDGQELGPADNAAEEWQVLTAKRQDRRSGGGRR